MTPFERLLNEALERMFNSVSVGWALNQVVDSGLPQATRALYDDRLRFVSLLLEDAETREWLGGHAVSSPEQTARSAVDRMVANAKTLVAATSLVFGHAMTDSAAMDCCKAVATARPRDCVRYIEDQKVTVRELTTQPPDTLIGARIDGYLRKLDRASLLDKCDFILQTCPERPMRHPLDYSFDRERLSRVDGVRHEVVHGQGSEAVARLQDGDQRFLELTAYYFIERTAQALSARLDMVELRRVRAEEARGTNQGQSV